ncbi:general secretion pathway protein GspB [Alteromonas gracilis]|uniref:general secretion pathway protein GspB n=1 Tax=Alteromonas gracilis TaxID=1479524 RepID=UPI00373647AA
MSSIVAIENLTPGMVIVQITKQNGPVKIRKSGLVTSDAMVQGLSEMGVQELEIDPEQTVEIAPTVHHRTQTQALLRGEHDTTANFDKSLNEQFNRSLFLPTVEGLPSAWKLYTKQVALFAVVILGGLCIGFSVVTTERWWPLLTATPASSQSVPANKPSVSEIDDAKPEPTDLAATQTDINSKNDADASKVNPSEATSQPIQSSAQDVISDSAGNTKPIATSTGRNGASQSGAAYTETPPVGQANNNDVVARNPNSNTINEYQDNRSPSQQQSTQSQDYEGKVLNESTSQLDVSVSPELVARFNAAVQALDSKAQDNDESTETTVTVKDELPRVDQLPVRLLTRLPSMNFSAHMYASRPSDRWVRVNGRQIGEGDWIADRVQIVNIEAQRVVLSFEEELFTMAALTDW